jgi:hypothetical protein
MSGEDLLGRFSLIEYVVRLLIPMSERRIFPGSFARRICDGISGRDNRTAFCLMHLLDITYVASKEQTTDTFDRHSPCRQIDHTTVKKLLAFSMGLKFQGSGLSGCKRFWQIS